MIDKLSAQEKVKLIKLLFTRIFKYDTPADMKGMNISSSSGQIIFKPFPNSKGLRGFIHDSGLLLLEQNPGKRTWCAELASSGIRCAWVMKQGSFLSFVIQWEGEIFIIKTDPRNRNKVERAVDSIIKGTYKAFKPFHQAL